MKWLLNIILVVSLMTIGLHASENLMQVPVYRTSLSDAVVSMLKKFTGPEYAHFCILARTSSHDYRVQYLLNEILFWVRDSISYQHWNMTVKSETYSHTHNLFLVDTYQTFQELYTNLNERTNNFKGFYLIVFSDVIADQNQTLERLFLDCYNLYITNVNVIVKRTDSSDSIIDIFTYFPFTRELCRNMQPKLYNTFVNGTFSQSSDMFPEKVRNFYGCPIKVITWNYPPHMIMNRLQDGTIEYSGIEGQVLRMLSRKMNFSVALVDPIYEQLLGTIYKNGTGTGTMGMLLRGDGNMTICAHRYVFSNSKRMSVSMNYFYTSMVFAIPCFKGYTSFEKVFFSFSFPVWFVIVLLFSGGYLVFVVLKLLDRKYLKFLVGKQYRTPFLNMFNITIGGVVPTPPTRNFARTLFIVWIFGMMVLRSIYQGSLFRNLQNIGERETTHNLLTLLDEGYVLYVPRDSMDWFQRVPEVQGKFLELNESPWKYFTYMQRPNYKGIILTTTVQVDFFNRRNKINGTVTTLPQRLLYSPLSIYYRKNSFLTDHIDRILHRAVAGGLIEHWAGEYLNEQRPKYIRQKEVTNSDLEGCYELMAIPLCFAIVVFCLEMIAKRFKFVKVVFDFLTYK